jgi:glycosyltransferase involved in cell wall biosynthesis
MATKIPITIIILTKNEEPRIEDCIKSVVWADEIIVIDNGSTDRTVETAKKLGAVVIGSKEKDFSRLRELGSEKSTNDWILYIDADETVPESLQKEILYTIETFHPETSPVGYNITRKNYYLGNVLWPVRDSMMRLFFKKSLVGWQGKVHETAQITGSSKFLKEPLIHITHRTLEEMVAKTNVWSQTEADLRFEAHHPKIVPWRIIRVMITAFWDSYIRQKGWKAGIGGMIESIYQAFSMFITYAKVWEKQQNQNKK